MHAKIEDIENRMPEFPVGSKNRIMMEEHVAELKQIIKANKEAEELQVNKPGGSKIFRLANLDFHAPGKKNMKRIGRAMMQFVSYIRQHRISLEDAINMPIYKEPHFLKDSKEFFMHLRTGNIDAVKKMVMMDRMLLFQIDYVRY